MAHSHVLSLACCIIARCLSLFSFQQNIHRLPEEDVTKCINGILEIERTRASFKKPAHFGEWLQQSFGTGLCDVFMVRAYPAT